MWGCAKTVALFYYGKVSFTKKCQSHRVPHFLATLIVTRKGILCRASVILVEIVVDVKKATSVFMEVSNLFVSLSLVHACMHACMVSIELNTESDDKGRYEEHMSKNTWFGPSLCAPVSAIFCCAYIKCAESWFTDTLIDPPYWFWRHPAIARGRLYHRIIV